MSIPNALGGELPQQSAEDSYNILLNFTGAYSGPPIRDYMVLNAFYGDRVLRKGKWVLSFYRGLWKHHIRNWQFRPGEVKE